MPNITRRTNLGRKTRNAMNQINYKSNRTAQKRERQTGEVFEMYEDITQKNSQNCKNYRTKQKKKTNSEYCRIYRLRKKLLAQELQPENEDLHIPSTSSLQMTFEPQPFTTEMSNSKEDDEDQLSSKNYVTPKEIKEEINFEIKLEDITEPTENPFQKILVEIKEEVTCHQQVYKNDKDSENDYHDKVKIEVKKELEDIVPYDYYF